MGYVVIFKPSSSKALLAFPAGVRQDSSGIARYTELSPYGARSPSRDRLAGFPCATSARFLALPVLGASLPHGSFNPEPPATAAKVGRSCCDQPLRRRRWLRVKRLAPKTGRAGLLRSGHGNGMNSVLRKFRLATRKERPSIGQKAVTSPALQDMDNKTNATLLERLRQGTDPLAWQEFSDRYWRLIFVFAKHRGCSDHTAEEVVQEVMVEVFRQRDTFCYDPARGRFRDWLGTVVRNLVAKFRRQPAQRIRGQGGDDAEARSRRPATAAPTTLGMPRMSRRCWPCSWMSFAGK